MRGVAYRRLGLSAMALTVCVTAAMWCRPDRDLATVPGARILAAEPGKLRWYRGNLHTHSLWSDGDDYPEMIALWYRDHGYNFLGFTDHNTLHTGEKWVAVNPQKSGSEALKNLKEKFPGDWVETRKNKDGKEEVRLKPLTAVSQRVSVPGNFLLIQGEEISDRFNKYPIHLNATNSPEMITPRGGESVYEVMQNNVDAANAVRERTGRTMMVHINHPNFGYAITAEELARVRGERFFEVYNGHPAVYNRGNAQRASTDRIWDVLLTLRLTDLQLPVMYGLATDDGHNYHAWDDPKKSHPGRGWVMVLADELTPEALINAMEAGRFYASSGVELSKVVSSDDGLEIKIVPKQGVKYGIEFIGTRKGFDNTSSPVVDARGNELRTTRRYSDEIGVTLQHVKGTHAKYEFQGNELYVRARITSSKRHPDPSEEGEFERAWVQPVVGPAAKGDAQ